MTYDGWFRLGGAEVVNNERLAAYLDHGITPLGAVINVETCEGLAAAMVEDWQPYRTPLQDEAPWYDVDDPDTWDFAGVLVTEVTGLDDSTRSLDVTTTLDGSGIAGRPTRTPRVVGVTAVLVGRTSQACQAGLSWLQRLLHGDCDSDEQPVQAGAPLEFFTGCPGPLAPTADMSLPPEVKYALTDPADWHGRNGSVSDAGDDTILFRPFDDSLTVDAGGAGPDEDGIDDAGGADEVPGLYDGGDAILYGAGYLLATPQDGCLPGPVTITWTIRGDYPGATVQAVILDEAGAVAEYGPKWDLTDDEFPAPEGDFSDFTFTWEVPFGVDLTRWTPALVTDDTVQALTVEVSGQPLLPVSACLTSTLRTLPGVVCSTSPTVTDQIDTGCDYLLVVEWIWTARSPYRYSPPTRVLTGLGYGEAPSYTAPGVTYDEGGTLISAAPWDCDPPAAVAACYTDPSLPGFGSPPATPVIADFRRIQITDEDGIRSMWALVGPEQIPGNEGTFTISLSTDTEPVVGVRVRVWDDADADGTVPDNCDFAYEFLIDYIPEQSQMVIDGDSITTLCGGLAVPQDSSSDVRGAFGGPIQRPVVRCNRRYLVLVQWMDAFPRSAPGYFIVADPTGTLTLDLDVTIREG